MAGHEPPLYIADGSTDAAYLTDEPRPALGILPDSSYEKRSIELPPGSTLLLYTDGVLHAENPDGNQFGAERLKRTVQQASPEGAGAVKERLVRALKEHSSGGGTSDDIAFVALHRGSRHGPAGAQD